MIKILSLDYSCFVEMDINSTSEGPLPSREFSVQIQSHSFSGSLQSAWIEENSLMHFSKELQRVLSHQSETALLESISPGEFQMLVEAVPNKGYALLKVRMAKPVYLRDELIYHKLEGGFEADRSELVQALEGFRF